MLNKKGISLIELLVFIIVAGIFVPFSYYAFSSVLTEAVTPEVYTKARFLAETKIEEITSDVFDRILVGSTGYYEVPGNPGYMWKWEIRYARYDEYGGTIEIGDSTIPTNYKRITVWVKNSPKNIEYRVSTVVTKRPLDEQ